MSDINTGFTLARANMIDSLLKLDLDPATRTKVIDTIATTAATPSAVAGLSPNIQNLPTTIPIAQEGLVIGSNYHNSLRDAIQAIVDALVALDQRVTALEQSRIWFYSSFDTLNNALQGTTAIAVKNSNVATLVDNTGKLNTTAYQNLVTSYGQTAATTILASQVKDLQTTNPAIDLSTIRAANGVDSTIFNHVTGNTFLNFSSAATSSAAFNVARTIG